MNPGGKERLRGSDMDMVGGDDGDCFDAVGASRFRLRHLREAAIGALLGDTELERTGPGTGGIGGKRARDELIAVVEARGDAMNGPDEGAGTPANHAQGNPAPSRAAFALALDGHVQLSSGQAEQASVRHLIDAGASKIVESAARGFDDVFGDEGRAFGCTLLAALDTALPFQHGPTGVIV